MTIFQSKPTRYLWLAVLVAAGMVLGMWTTDRNSQRISTDEVIADAVEALEAQDVQSVQNAINLLGVDPKFKSEATILRGARSLLLNRPESALREFADVDPTGPLRLPLLILTGEALYRVGRLVEAENCLQQAIVEAPENAKAHRWLATVYYDNGSMDRALFHLETVSRIDPIDFRPYRMRGVILNDFGEYEKAEVAFRKAQKLAILPSDQSIVLESLALVQMTRKEFHAALKSLQKCQDSPSVFSDRAECCWNLGDSDQAEKLLAQAAIRGVVPPGGRRLKARMLIEKQKPTEAIEVLAKVLTEDASDDESEYLLAMAYRLLGNNIRYNQHLQNSEKLKTLKVELTALSQQAMAEPGNSQIREEMARVCDQLGLKQMARLWRLAAAAINQETANKGVTP